MYKKFPFYLDEYICTLSRRRVFHFIVWNSRLTYRVRILLGKCNSSIWKRSSTLGECPKKRGRSRFRREQKGMKRDLYRPAGTKGGNARGPCPRSKSGSPLVTPQCVGW